MFWGPSRLRGTGSWGAWGNSRLWALEAGGLGWLGRLGWLGLLWGASGLRGTGSWGARVIRVARVRVARVTRVKGLGWLLVRGLRIKCFFDF